MYNNNGRNQISQHIVWLFLSYYFGKSIASLTTASQLLQLYLDIQLKLNELSLHLMNKLNISAACLNEWYIVHQMAQSFTYPYKRGTLMVIRGLCSLLTVYDASPFDHK